MNTGSQSHSAGKPALPWGMASAVLLDQILGLAVSHSMTPPKMLHCCWPPAVHPCCGWVMVRHGLLQPFLSRQSLHSASLPCNAMTRSVCCHCALPLVVHRAAVVLGRVGLHPTCAHGAGSSGLGGWRPHCTASTAPCLAVGVVGLGLFLLHAFLLPCFSCH